MHVPRRLPAPDRQRHQGPQPQRPPVTRPPSSERGRLLSKHHHGAPPRCPWGSLRSAGTAGRAAGRRLGRCLRPCWWDVSPSHSHRPKGTDTAPGDAVGALPGTEAPGTALLKGRHKTASPELAAEAGADSPHSGEAQSRLLSPEPFPVRLTARLHARSCPDLTREPRGSRGDPLTSRKAASQGSRPRPGLSGAAPSAWRDAGARRPPPPRPGPRPGALLSASQIGDSSSSETHLQKISCANTEGK